MMYKIRAVQLQDISQITELYNDYAVNSMATFAINPLPERVFEERMHNLRYPFLVAENNEEVLSMAYLSAFRPHDAYQHVAEASIYVAKKYHGQGIGKAMYQRLFDIAPEYGILEIVAVLASPNIGSEKLHQALGFKSVGKMFDVGYKFNQYHDITLWQKSLNKEDR